MIYVDEIRDYFGKGKWSHMWTDGDVSDLHEFAAKLGLKRKYVHHSKGILGDFIHYDLTPNKRQTALNNGAVFKPLKEWIKEKRS